MKKLLMTIAAFTVAFTPLFAPISAANAATAGTFYYGAWIPFWQAQPGEEDVAVHLSSLNEISPFSYEVASDGTLIDDLGIGSGSWSGWLEAVHDFGEKIIPTIAWFNGGQIYNLLSNTKKRIAEENTVTQLVKVQNFNGIDVDFEGMVAATKPYFSLFIEGLALRLHPLGKVVTCTLEPLTPPADLAGGVASDAQFTEDYATLAKYCDEIRVMTYDQGTIDQPLDAEKGNGTFYAPVADPAWEQKVIQETLKYVSPKKVMLAIPTYGYEYEVSWATGILTYQRIRAFDYLAAMDRADTLGIAPTRDNADEMSFTYTSSTYIQEPPSLTYTTFSTQPTALTSANSLAFTTFFVTFPDSKTMQDEIALAKQYGLRGVMLFKADGDIDPAIWGTMALH
jgi:spore germination protein YaaH